MAQANKKAPAKPRSNRKKPKPIETGNEQVGQDGIVDISLEGAAALDKPEIQVVDGPDALKKAEELAFMEEKMTITVATTTDKNAENPVLVSVNGRNMYFFRGVATVCKRKYVERLARAKATSFAQNLDATDPEEYNRLMQTTSLQYPFSVVTDPNPAGSDWLLKILAEA